MTVGSIAQTQMSDAMLKLSTMKRVNSASDDAAGLAIMEKMEGQIRGIDRGTDNTLDMKNLVRTAEGGLSGIEDSLQRVRELSVQASNGIYTDSDRQLIQNEVSQLMDGINDVAKNTEFNGQKLLDGSFTEKHTASSADGSGADVTIPNMDAIAIGLDGFDVSKGNFDIGTIDKALSLVSSARSTLGAMENRFDYTVNSNNVMMLNQVAAKSRIADLDMAKGVSDMEKGRVLNEMAIYNQRQQQERARMPLSLLG
ncbi:MAG: flagellin [Clostridiales bacterium]|jgi:flagellin|nr:flagellin [Clostridiales bacterium]